MSAIYSIMKTNMSYTQLGRAFRHYRGENNDLKAKVAHLEHELRLRDRKLDLCGKIHRVADRCSSRSSKSATSGVSVYHDIPFMKPTTASSNRHTAVHRSTSQQQEKTALPPPVIDTAHFLKDTKSSALKTSPQLNKRSDTIAYAAEPTIRVSGGWVDVPAD